SPVSGPIFIGGADQLDSGHQPGAFLLAHHLHLEDIRVLKIERGRDGRLGRRPDGDATWPRHWAIGLFGKSADINLYLASLLDAGLGDKSLRQQRLIQIERNRFSPSARETVPVT